MELYFNDPLSEKIERYYVEILRIAEKSVKKPHGSLNKRASRDFQMRRIQAKLDLLLHEAHLERDGISAGI